MAIVGAVASAAIIDGILIEAFEAMVLPRRVMRTFRFNRFFYRQTWPVWLFLSRALPTGETARNLSQRLRSAVAAGSVLLLGGGICS